MTDPAAENRALERVVHLDDEAADLARLAARAAGAVALAVFVILVWQQGIPRSIQPRQWEILSQLAVLAFVSFGYIFAYRWELVGALAMLSGSVLLGTLASIATPRTTHCMAALRSLSPGCFFCCTGSAHTAPWPWRR